MVSMPLDEQIALDIAALDCQQNISARKLDALNDESPDLLCQLNTLVELVKLMTEQTRQSVELKRIAAMVKNF